MAPYLKDWRGRYEGVALAVVRPGSTEEVRATVAWARAHSVGIVPQGGNTGLAGGATPTSDSPDGPAQIVLSLTRMARVRKVDRVAMTLEAEAGCIVEHAKQAAVEAGRFLPISFGAQGSATIGGMIATNAGGINALRYGTARQLVLGLEAVLADGTVVRGLGGLRKDNAGYDWKQLLIGSEGTLGIVTAAVLRLAPLPAERELAFAAVASPERALALLERCQDAMGDAISAFELMSGPTMEIVVGHLGGRAPLASPASGGGPADWLVLIEVADSAGRLRGRLEGALADAADAGVVLDAALPESAEQTRRFWTLRESVGEAERRGERSVKHDVAVRVSDVPAFIRDAEAALARLSPALRTIVFGHLGDGNLHFNVVVPRNGTGAASVADEAVTRAVHDVVARFGGSITAEHGIGQYRTGELLRLKAPEELALMRRLKRALDPEGLLNPGKVISGEPPSGWSPPL
jgi:FAD/FMN-containing dehydrogenase